MAGEAGAFLAGSVFLRGPRTAALTLVAALTVGSLTFFFDAAWPRPEVVEAAAVFLAAALPRAVPAFVMAFLTPALMDPGVSNLRFLPPRAAVPSIASASFRLVPIVFLIFRGLPVVFFSSTPFAR